MKLFLIIVTILISGQFNCFATLQESDYLIWKKDTLHLNISPLSMLKNVCHKIRENEAYEDSSCWNGYIAEWVIIDSILYLKNIYSYSTKKNINKRLEKIIGKKFKNGLLKAEWFSGNFFGKFGRKLHYLYYTVYEKERKFSFNKGILKSIKEFNAKNIKYSIDKNKLKEYVYSNLNWNIFKTNQKFKINNSVYIRADDSGTLEFIKFESKASKKVNKEVERVLRLIPNWGVYYLDGKVYNFFGSFYFEFNNDNMEKYSPQ